MASLFALSGIRSSPLFARGNGIFPLNSHLSEVKHKSWIKCSLRLRWKCTNSDELETHKGQRQVKRLTESVFATCRARTHTLNRFGCNPKYDGDINYRRFCDEIGFVRLSLIDAWTMILFITTKQPLKPIASICLIIVIIVRWNSHSRFSRFLSLSWPIKSIRNHC